MAYSVIAADVTQGIVSPEAAAAAAAFDDFFELRHGLQVADFLRSKGRTSGVPGRRGRLRSHVSVEL